MKPWDVEAISLEDDARDALWLKCVPGDFIFAFHPPRYVSVTPAEYSNQHGYMYDQHLCCDLFPDYFEGIQEGTYETGRSYTIVKKALIKRGFTESVKLADFLKQHPVGKLAHIRDVLGFDLSTASGVPTRIRVRCSQCEAICINSVLCHETGCPNARAAARREREAEFEEEN